MALNTILGVQKQHNLSEIMIYCAQWMQNHVNKYVSHYGMMRKMQIIHSLCIQLNINSLNKHKVDKITQSIQLQSKVLRYRGSYCQVSSFSYELCSTRLSVGLLLVLKSTVDVPTVLQCLCPVTRIAGSILTLCVCVLMLLTLRGPVKVCQVNICMSVCPNTKLGKVTKASLETHCKYKEQNLSCLVFVVISSLSMMFISKKKKT